ncbi:hypothetical protein [Streptomyces sp. NPDC020681]|uniref:hypothetical protein n=1 Tax=Streptomyces sp. NPDC020681 TaxID=3365083 RepID=UPI0037A88453
MKLRRISRAAGLAVGVLTAWAAATAPASAATVNWKEIHPNSNWTCGKTVQHATYPGVGFQVCWIGNANDDAQAVLVVNNNGPKGVNIRASVVVELGPSFDCAASVLNPGFTRGCFGSTNPMGCDTVYDTTAYLDVNGSTKTATLAMVRACWEARRG